jgi:hypothetical protein
VQKREKVAGEQEMHGRRAAGVDIERPALMGDLQEGQPGVHVQQTGTLARGDAGDAGSAWPLGLPSTLPSKSCDRSSE